MTNREKPASKRSPETGASYRARWAAVNARQDQELQRLTTDNRLDQLLQLYELRHV